MKGGEIGKVINLITNFDLSGAGTLSIILTPPGGTAITKTGSCVTAPNTEAPPLVANQHIRYTTEAGDIENNTNLEQTWEICGLYEDSTPKKYYSDSATFVVSPSPE